MKKEIIYIISISCLSILLLSCNKDNNKTRILSKEKIQNILHDTYLAESMYELRYSDFALNDKRELMIENILKKHEVTQAEFDSSLVWYSDNAELFSRVNDSVVSSLKKDLGNIQKQSNKSFNEFNFNIISSYSYLSKDEPLLSFEIDSLQINNFPNFSLKFNTFGFDRLKDANFVVNYVYTDTIISDKHTILNDNLFTSNLADNKIAQSLKSVNGYVYADPDRLDDKKVLIYNIKINK